MSSKGECRVWTGKVEPDFQEVLCAMTPQGPSLLTLLCCEGQTLWRSWQRARVEQYFCPWGRMTIVAPACTLLHPLSLWSLPCWLLPPPALFPPAVQLSDWRIFLTRGIGQHPLVPALGGSHSTLLAAELQPRGCFSPDKSSTCGFSDTALRALVVP